MTLSDPLWSNRFFVLASLDNLPIIISYLVVLILLLLLSAFFSATETAFTSLNVIRIKQMAKSSKKIRKNAKLVYELQKDYSDLLNTVLVGNNTVNITASSIVTFLFANILGMQEQGVLIATLLVTSIIIVFGEILPKNFAKLAPEKVACWFVKPIYILIYIFKPITFWFSKINDRMEKHNEEDRVTATEDELLEIVETIEREGVLEQDESELIQSAINFDSLSVRAVMTPRDNVILLYTDTSFSEAVNAFKKYKYSRFPILDKKTDKIVGVLFQQDVFDCLANNNQSVITKLMRKTMYISHRRLLPYALEEIQRQKAHMAIVVDNIKEKNFLGVITLEDILEELVGEIYDEYDDLPSDVVEIGHHIFEVTGSTKLKNLFDNYLDDTSYPKTKAQTVGTWVKSMIKGEINKDVEVKYDNLVIKIIDCENHVIKKVEIDHLTKQEEDI